LRGVPVPQRPWLQAVNEIYRATMRDSALLNAIADATGDEPPDGSPPDRAGLLRPRTVYLATPRDEDRRALRLTARLLLEIAAKARRIGARPIVVIIPELWQVRVANDASLRDALRQAGVHWRRTQQVLRRDLAREGVETIDLLPALAHGGRTSDGQNVATYYTGWKHLNALGHRVVARHLATELGLRCDVPRLRPPPGAAATTRATP
jgi:hypothetical protein